MNIDEIIKLAREAGLPMAWISGSGVLNWTDLKDFANLVAAAEREACAELCVDLDDDIVDGLAGWQYGEAIRARGTK